MHFGGRRLRGANRTVVPLGRCEIVVTHDDLQRLCRDARIDQPLSTPSAEIVGAGKFLPLPGTRILLDHDDAGCLADHRNDSDYPLLGQTGIKLSAFSSPCEVCSATNGLYFVIRYRTGGPSCGGRSGIAGLLVPVSHRCFRNSARFGNGAIAPQISQPAKIVGKRSISKLAVAYALHCQRIHNPADSICLGNSVETATIRLFAGTS